MYAVVEIAGQQFKVKAGLKVYVHRLDADTGANLSFDKVMLTMNEDGSNAKVGTPSLPVKVNATVVDHVRGDKVLVFKKKRRKGYQKMNGHRQHFTQIEITSIG